MLATIEAWTLGLTNWITKSSLKMFTSSIAGIALTPILFKVLCNFLSSVVDDLCTAFFFLHERAKKKKFINQKHPDSKKSKKITPSRTNSNTNKQKKRNPWFFLTNERAQDFKNTKNKAIQQIRIQYYHTWAKPPKLQSFKNTKKMESLRVLQ